MTHTDVFRAFGFDVSSGMIVESIYPYAPVYHLSNTDGDWIVKRTQKPLARGQAVAAWAQTLAARGIQIITPAKNFGHNPRAFKLENDLEEIWVVYPFIAGNSYSGTTVQIAAAGSLLGQIHAASKQVDPGLKRSETVVAVDEQEIAQDIEAITQQMHTAFPEFAARAGSVLAERAHRYFQQSLPRLLETHLPPANCSWDFKASNLIYPNDDSPILVDADNAGCIPRLYDLAIAALLFHNEGMGPPRLFTSAEWTAFLEGYTRHIQFTDTEKQTWQDVLLCAWMDEGLWLIRNDQLGWANPHQSRMLLSLLFTDLSTFTLVS
jgi:Ser/Thr protein kinase RdoA (MazF antagonist)